MLIKQLLIKTSIFAINSNELRDTVYSLQFSSYIIKIIQTIATLIKVFERFKHHYIFQRKTS